MLRGLVPMIIIHGEHILDEAGKQYFPEWLDEVAAAHYERKKQENIRQ